MQVNPERLRVVEKWPWRGGSMIAMRSVDSGWRILAEADSREEMDLKLASMGLEVDWEHWNAGTQYRIRRIGG